MAFISHKIRIRSMYPTWLLAASCSLILMSTYSIHAMELGSQSIDVLSGQQVALQSSDHRLVYSKQSIAEHPVTVRTVLQAGDNAKLEQISNIWLVGLAPVPSEPESGISLVWAKDTSGWWASWNLQLQNGLSKNDVPITVKNVSPIADHNYEALLSADPTSDRVAVRVTDLTTKELICTAVYNTDIQWVQVSALAGLTFNSSAGDQTSHVGHDPDYKASDVRELAYNLAFTPVNLKWEVESKAADSTDDNYSPVWLLSSGDTSRLHIANTVPSDGGKINVYVDKGTNRQLLASMDGSVEVLNQPIDSSIWTVGQTRLVLEYAVGTQAVLTDSLAIRMGRASVRFSTLEVDRQRGVVEGTAYLTADSNLTSLQLAITAQVYKKTWDTDTKTYHDDLRQTETAFTGSVAVSPQTGELAVPLNMKLPNEAGMWAVKFAVSTDPQLQMVPANADRQFTTYPAAQIQPGQPFTIAVLPDTQYYIQSYPDIMTRQVEFLAQNAASRNIAFALHVGDITNNNTPEQWAVAQDRIGELREAVPLVMAVGNHDISSNGSHIKTDTLINKYFPGESFSALQGTYEPNDVSNSYHTFTVGDRKFLAMALEFGPRNGVLDWANKVVDAHPDYSVMVVTHTYTSSSGSRVTPGTSGGSPELVLPPEVKDTNNGEDMWNKFISKHPNIIVVVSGHIGVSTIPYNIGFGEKGNKVYEFLADFQGEPHGGDGWLVLLTFQPEGLSEIRSYSPYLERYKTEIDKRRNGNYMTVNPANGWITVH